MRRIFIVILCLLTFAPASSHEEEAPATRPALLDTMIRSLTLRYDSLGYRQPAEVSARIYVRGTSECTRKGLPSRLMRHLMPFECSDRKSVFEGIVQASYRYPYQLRAEIQAFRGSQRYSKAHLREVFQAFLPLYNVDRPRSMGNRNALVAPFSRDGLNEYDFTLSDTLRQYGELCCWIRFRPRHRHHALQEGYILTSADGHNVYAASLQCLVDFAKAEISLNFDNLDGEPHIRQSHIEIRYKYMNAEGINRYDCYYQYNHVSWLDDINPDTLSLDVTDYYYTSQLPENALDSLRPFSLPAEMAKALDDAEEERRWEELRKQKKQHIDEETHEVIDPDEDRGFKDWLKKLPERLVATSHYDVWGSDFKLYGPFEPSAFGYDGLNGFTLRTRARINRRFNDGKRLYIYPEVGYAFGRRELRYAFEMEFIHHPRQLQGLRLSVNKKQASFPNKFKDIINDAIKASDTTDVDFDALGIDYYDHHEFKLEHFWEIRNGLTLFAGANYNLRTPRKHGSRAMTRERIDALVDSRYSDISPYLRLVWTPHQFYRYEQKEKRYVESPYPTFEAEYLWGKNIDGGHHHSFSRVEFDIHQVVRIDPLRNFSYHAGFGHFFHKENSPFFNYRYFSRSQYPDSWDERIGGTFSLLDDYWFGSTPAYIQMHAMYESPFFLLYNLSGALSKYVISERIYLSHLIADGKPLYTEAGYGFGNNYLSIAGFVGLNGMRYQSFGFKFQLVLWKHI